MNDTPTPRVDAQALDVYTSHCDGWLSEEKATDGKYVRAEFARDLERQLAQLSEDWRASSSQWVAKEREWANATAEMERQLAEATAWRPIDDTPPEGVNIVLWSPYECEVGQRWGDDYSREDMKCLTPTHWQPLPNPPTEKP